jgi:hypothetical protein
MTGYRAKESFMRRTMMAAAVAAAFGAVLTVAGGSASAAPGVAAPGVHRPLAAETVQYYPGWHGHRDFDERRYHRREMRRAYEQERIADAARREARRIEIERAERRAWRHAHRERHGFYRGF